MLFHSKGCANFPLSLTAGLVRSGLYSVYLPECFAALQLMIASVQSANSGALQMAILASKGSEILSYLLILLIINPTNFKEVL